MLKVSVIVRYSTEFIKVLPIPENKNMLEKRMEKSTYLIFQHNSVSSSYKDN